MIREILKISIPSFISVCGVIIVAMINSKGKRQKELEEAVKNLQQGQEQLKKDVSELKSDVKETHIYLNETIKVLTTAFNEHKDIGEFNGETTSAIRHMQQVLVDNAIL